MSPTLVAIASLNQLDELRRPSGGDFGDEIGIIVSGEAF